MAYQGAAARRAALGRIWPELTCPAWYLQVPLRAVLPFLEGGLRSAGEQRRNSMVVRSLRRAENLQVREDLIRCRQRCALESHAWPRDADEECAGCGCISDWSKAA